MLVIRTGSEKVRGPNFHKHKFCCLYIFNVMVHCLCQYDRLITSCMQKRLIFDVKSSAMTSEHSALICAASDSFSCCKRELMIYMCMKHLNLDYIHVVWKDVDGSYQKFGSASTYECHFGFNWPGIQSYVYSHVDAIIILYVFARHPRYANWWNY